MITNNGMLRNMVIDKKEEPLEEHKETHTEEHKEHIKEEEYTYNLLSSIISILPHLVNKPYSSENFDYKSMLEKVHNLDKRIAVCEALLNSNKE